MLSPVPQRPTYTLDSEAKGAGVFKCRIGLFFFTYQASMVIQQVWAYVGKKSVAQSRLENDPYGMAWLTFNR
jgi:hypothetical protein